ncbi:MAG: nitrogen fixation protein FixC [Rhizobiales bacterium 32-66-11]|nr:MAG: nitrogen fixation protein FixC [Rhizobiales bacterium 32-66-11]
MIEEKFDAIVVGAGMAGNAAALTLAQRGLKVLQLEFNEEKPNRYTIIRAQFDKWFSSKVKEAGAVVLCETTVTELVQDAYGKVIGVRTDRKGGQIHADVVVLAEGVNGLLGTRSGLRERPKPDNVALAVKEMHFLPRETIEARFNLKGDEGTVIEAVGTISRGMTGMGFIYANKECVSLGIGCLVADFQKSGETPYGLLERFKSHPSVAPLIEGSEVKEYSAHLIPEGGYKAIPKLYGDGWVVVGDAAQLNNAIHREGSNLAMTSGRIAAEAIFQIKSRREPMTAKNLALYKTLLDDSFVIKDLKKYKDMPALMHVQSQNFFLTYPQLVSKAMQNFVRVDGTPKIEKEKMTLRSFVAARSWAGLFGDAFRFARAWR